VLDCWTHPLAALVTMTTWPCLLAAARNIQTLSCSLSIDACTDGGKVFDTRCIVPRRSIICPSSSIADVGNRVSSQSKTSKVLSGSVTGRWCSFRIGVGIAAMVTGDTPAGLGGRSTGNCSSHHQLNRLAMCLRLNMCPRRMSAHLAGGCGPEQSGADVLLSNFQVVRREEFRSRSWR
jgi:hypothetical protein